MESVNHNLLGPLQVGVIKNIYMSKLRKESRYNSVVTGMTECFSSYVPKTLKSGFSVISDMVAAVRYYTAQ